MGNRGLCALVLLAGALALTACGGSGRARSPQATIGFEGMALEQGAELAPASTTRTTTVDGIPCGQTEQLAYHLDAHLLVYDRGVARALPAGIGVPGSRAVDTSQGPIAAGGWCFEALETHAPDGVIDVGAGIDRAFTLGNFFDEWRQPLSTDHVAGARGKVTAIVNGKVWGGDPRQIPLTSHAVIQLDVGTPAVAFHNVSWAGTEL